MALNNSQLKNNQLRIYNILKSLKAIPKVDVTCKGTIDVLDIIYISHPQMFVPDMLLEWCTNKNHYRLYIHIASTFNNKVNAGYCIATISNGLVASGLVMVYSFLHKNRANNRTQAE